MTLATPIRVNVHTASADALISSVTSFTEQIRITNNGPNPIYLGLTSGVTAANGYPVPAAGTITFTPNEVRNLASLFAIAGTADQASPANTSVLVTTRD